MLLQVISWESHLRRKTWACTEQCFMQSVITLEHVFKMYSDIIRIFSISQIRRTSDSCSRRWRTPFYSPIWRSTIWFRWRSALQFRADSTSFSRTLTNVSVRDYYFVSLRERDPWNDVRNDEEARDEKRDRNSWCHRIRMHTHAYIDTCVGPRWASSRRECCTSTNS